METRKGVRISIKTLDTKSEFKYVIQYTNLGTGEIYREDPFDNYDVIERILLGRIATTEEVENLCINLDGNTDGSDEFWVRKCTSRGDYVIEHDYDDIDGLSKYDIPNWAEAKIRLIAMLVTIDEIANY